MENNDFDVSRARLQEPDLFKRFSVPDEGIPLKKVNLSDGENLIIAKRGGKRCSFLVKQIMYHHVAQGVLADRPYLISFCGICHSGIGFIPMVDDKLYHFSAGGLYNGTVLLIDDETRSYWNHMTGECLHGSLKGKKLDAFPLEITNYKTALTNYPEISIFISKMGFKGKLMDFFIKKVHFSKGFLPPGFKKTMGKIDERLPALSHGLGIFFDNFSKFYPYEKIGAGIEEMIDGRRIIVKVRDGDNVPYAKWQDSDKIPLQIFTRWYGFSFSFPDCDLFE